MTTVMARQISYEETFEIGHNEAA